MAKWKFWNICKFLCISFFQITWLLILIIFVILPRFTFNSFRRVHIKNKIQRKLRKNGLPKKLAKIQAKQYKSMLIEYGSIRGLWKLNKERKKISKKEKNENSNNEVDKK